ncbi:MAG TPA: hypothetical protein VGC76_02145 [Pyrinomonadaceae bacterium]|jgi:hypothetical protein
MINPNERWQVDVGGEIYETNFEGLVNWIAEGSLLAVDKVRRGNLRWLEAGKIPLLYGFFNAKDLGQPMPQIQFSISDGDTAITEAPFQPAENVGATQNFAANQTSFSPPNNFTLNDNIPPTENFNPQPPPQAFYQPQFEQSPMPNANVCLVHSDVPANYFCETCANVFCKACPKGYGGNVKICPMCGSMCILITQLEKNTVESVQFQNDMREGFGIADFGRAIAYPFKFKASLFFGAFAFMLFTLGQKASGSGSFMMLGAVIICFMLSNMMTFSVLANTVENFSQGKIGGNFMPSFDDFSLWDDMVHPFFLNIAVYIVCFGLTIILIAGGAWYMWKTINTTMEKENPAVFTQMEKTQNPQFAQKNPANTNAQPVWSDDNDKAKQADLENMRSKLDVDKMKTVAGAPGDDIAPQRIVTALLKTAGILVIPILLSILWGLFYYPAACAVAAYTRSFSATLNPTIGLDTIRRLGFDYVKILGMTLLLIIFSFSIGFILSTMFKPFDLPKMGNLPAIAVGSWFTYYFSVVFAVILGYALYKNTEKMNLFRR